MSTLYALKSIFYKSVKYAGRTVGLEINKNNLRHRDDLRLVYYLNRHSVDLVLDVGANRGQFGKQLFENGFNGRIVSFEPLPDAYDKLTKAASQYGNKWIVAPRSVISNQEGEIDFNVTGADTSSSIYAPRSDFVTATPGVKLVKKIRVPTTRLDSISANLGLIQPNLFLKLDVQGAEKQVLEGAPEVLNAASGLITELTLNELYEGQPKAREVLEIINGYGFEIWDVWQGYRDPINNRLNQVDLICFKSRVT